MKKVFAAVLGVVAMLTLAAPAQAGTGFWSSTACWGTAPVNGTYYGYPGVGAEYRSAYSSNQSVLVFGRLHSYFASKGYECGYLGMPFYNGSYAGPGVPYKYLMSVVPFTCDLHITIAPDNAVTYDVTAAHYFC